MFLSFRWSFSCPLFCYLFKCLTYFSLLPKPKFITTVFYNDLQLSLSWFSFLLIDFSRLPLLYSTFFLNKLTYHRFLFWRENVAYDTLVMPSFNVTKNGLLKGRFPIFAKSQVLLYPLLSYSCFGKISAVASILYNISYDKGKGFYVQIHEALQLATFDSNFTCGCNISCDGCCGSTSNILQNQLVYKCISGNCWNIWVC